MPMTLISRQTLTGTAASVTFSNIPQTFQTLKLVVSSRDDLSASTSQDVYMQFNGDTGANYSFRRVYGTGSSTASDSVTSAATALRAARNDNSSATASTFSSNEITIPNYTGNANKAVSSDQVDENNATQALQLLVAALWSNTSAIQSIRLQPFTTANFVSGSTFSLYGVS